ncbi:MAG: hypothetical protein G01um101466_538 [Parcubacteria group bacterium Gr01-1014_66]|nr:MAG: hypothetical protein G01um101466_538 [Parcubacteria group bacterium Gr01-1014_66]
MEKLPGDYIAGFVDGEGCFALNFRRDVRHERPGSPMYFYWKIIFAITLRSDDSAILESIQNTLECGFISFTSNGSTINPHNSIRYQVSDMTDLMEKIVPFFDTYSLRAKKKYDFELWKQALKILFKYKNKRKIATKGQQGFIKTSWDREDVSNLEDIALKMKSYKSLRSSWKWKVAE